MIDMVNKALPMWAWWLMPVVSGVMMGLSFPPFVHTGWLAWVALVPLFFFLRRMPLKQAVFGGLLYSVVFNFIVMVWITAYGARAYIGLCVIGLGSEAIPYFLWLKFLGRDDPRRYFIWAPVTWVFYEYFRTLGDWAFPWGNIAHSQWGYLPLIQISSVTGIYGVTFLLVFFNAGLFVLADAVLKKNAKAAWHSAAVPAALVVVALLFGAARMSAPPGGEPITVAVAQQKEKTKGAWGQEKSIQVLDDYEKIITPLKKQKIDLVVLPESFAELYDYEKPRLPLCAESQLGLTLEHWMADAPFMLAYGAEGVDNICEANARESNSFFLRDSKGILGRIDKRRLVPMGEYIPLRPVMTKLFPDYPWGSADLQGGNAFDLLPFRLPGCAGKNCERPIGALICYEALFPQDARDFARKGARLLVSGTNSSWFTPSATEQMIRFEAFRPVETGLYLARAGTGGISTIIDPAGRFLVRLGQGTTEEGHAEIHLDTSRTFYTRHGDWLVWLAAALAFGLTAFRLMPEEPSK